MNNTLRYETITYRWINDPEEYEADVVIVPDTTDLSSDDFEQDGRIFFYFTETEWAQTLRGEYVEGIEFQIINTQGE